jgi:hypothetical protein
MVEGPEPAPGVIEHAVEDQAHAPRMDGVQELSKRRVPAQERVDLEVVVGVVAVVRGRAEYRGQVERGHPEVGELIEPFGDAEEVAALEAV